MNDLFWHFGGGYGVLTYPATKAWAGVSTTIWDFRPTSEPAFRFVNDSNTGFYFPNGTEIKFK